MKNFKKICIYMPTASYITGGAENVSINQGIYLNKYGYEVTFICIDYGTHTTNFKNLLNSNVNVVYLNHQGIDKKILENHELSHEKFHELYFHLGEQLYKYLNNHHFDIIVSHYTPAGLFIPNKIKSCMILHGTPTAINESDIIGLKKSQYKIAVSQSIKTGWKNLIKENMNINVVHNGIDYERFHYSGAITKNIDVFFVGRNIEIKGIQYLIKAIHYLKSNYNLKLNVVIGGTGPYQKVLKSLTFKYHLDNITFPGYIKERELNRYYNKSKIIALPSYEKEGVLTTLLEAASCQGCIVTCNCCGMKDFVIDGYNGIFCKKKNYIDLGEKIKTLYENNGLRERLGKHARQTILEDRTRDKSILKFINLINS